MASIKRENTSLSTGTKTKIGLISQTIRIEAKIRIEIIEANIGTRTRTGTNTAQVPSKIRKSTIVKTRTKRVHLRARTRSIRAVAHLARIKTGARNTITSQARVQRIRTGKMRRN